MVLALSKLVLVDQSQHGLAGYAQHHHLQSAPPVRGATYRADAHSVVLLCADLHDATDAQHAPAL